MSKVSSMFETLNVTSKIKFVSTYTFVIGAQSKADCMTCPAGFWCNDTGLSDYSLYSCELGYYCVGGTSILLTTCSFWLVSLQCQRPIFLVEIASDYFWCGLTVFSEANDKNIHRKIKNKKTALICKKTPNFPQCFWCWPSKIAGHFHRRQ